MGNPLLWLMSGAAVVGTMVAGTYAVIWKKVNVTLHPLFPMVMGFFAFWLPWVGVQRVVFLYHYFPSYGFALIMLAYWLAQWWKKQPYLVVGIVLVVMAVSALYLPWSVGWISLSEAWIERMVLIRSWLY